VGFDVLTICQPSTVWCSRERLTAAAAQPAKVRQSCSATDYCYYYYYYYYLSVSLPLCPYACLVYPIYPSAYLYICYVST
jgi:hypothetical protein